MAEEKISRRGFIDWVVKGGLLATLAGMVLPALAYLWPVMRRGPAKEFIEVGKENEFAVGDSKKIVLGSTVLLVIRTEKGFKAFSAICTHLGCIVVWEPQKGQIACPCHAGFFDLEGNAISGPPKQPLSVYSTSILDGKVFIKL